MKLKSTLLFTVLLTLLMSTQAQVISEIQRIVSDDIAVEDYFGNSAAIYGDYAIVGSLGDDENGSNSGSAYIFHNNSGVWDQTMKLTASDGETNNFFALSVAISGDYAFASAIGANAYAGKVYVFHHNAGTWIQTQILISSDIDEGDFFGEAMSIDGDYAIIGASGNDDDGDNSGSAYIFQLQSGAWVETAKITASDGDEYDFFSASVDMVGDYIMIGAEESETNGAVSGAVYVFHHNNGNWEQTQKLVTNDAVSGDHFGASVSMYGDHAVIGADSKSSSSAWVGAAYIFENNNGTWIQKQKLTASDAGGSKHFGNSASIYGNYLVIGSEGSISFDPHVRGAAYMFHNNSGIWEEDVKLISSDNSDSDLFAYVVDISDDYIFVGGPRNDGNGIDAGAVYIFDAFVPIILTQPISQENITEGEMVVFNIEADGVDLIYQWQKDGDDVVNTGNISGSNTNELTISAVTIEDAGSYTCLVSNNYGEAISEVAILSVQPSAIYQLSESNISIYPNPTIETFSISYQQSKLPFQLTILNAQSQMVWQNENVFSDQLIQLPPSFEAGVYFVRVFNEDVDLVLKLVVE